MSCSLFMATSSRPRSHAAAHSTVSIRYNNNPAWLKCSPVSRRQSGVSGKRRAHVEQDPTRVPLIVLAVAAYGSHASQPHTLTMTLLARASPALRQSLARSSVRAPARFAHGHAYTPADVRRSLVWSGLARSEADPLNCVVVLGGPVQLQVEDWLRVQDRRVPLDGSSHPRHCCSVPAVRLLSFSASTFVPTSPLIFSEKHAVLTSSASYRRKSGGGST